jgi:hypothetical protein
MIKKANIFWGWDHRVSEVHIHLEVTISEGIIYNST